jgi:hypothetical protein
MEHMNAETRADGPTDPELDDALARAIRQLIAEAIESGSVSDHGVSDHRVSGHRVSDHGAGSAQAAA